jgi:hypothetical protein
MSLAESSIFARTEMQPEPLCTPPLKLLHRCCQKLSNLFLLLYPSLRIIIGHSLLFEILIHTLDAGYPGYSAHPCNSSDGSGPQDMEHNNSITSSSESGLHSSSATDSDHGYEVYGRHHVHSVQNPDPPEAVLAFLVIIQNHQMPQFNYKARRSARELKEDHL